MLSPEDANRVRIAELRARPLSRRRIIRFRIQAVLTPVIAIAVWWLFGLPWAWIPPVALIAAFLASPRAWRRQILGRRA